MASPYIGNQDYRGYLNYLGTKQGDLRANNLLKYGVGNDAGFASSGALSQDLLNYNTNLYNQYQGLNAPANQNIGSIYGGLGGGGQAPAIAPNLNIAALNAQARKDAAKAVNPYYTKSLNDFVKQQSYEKSQQEAQSQTDLKNLQDQLDQTLGQNKTTGERTTQDVNTNLANIATNQDQFQTDTGNQFSQDRLAIAKGASTGGLGQQKVAGAQAARNTQEGRQEQQFAQQKQQQDLFKNRTFEDLARSSSQATEAKGKGEKQVQFNLNDYIKHQQFALSSEKSNLEKQRLQETAQKVQDLSRLAYNKFLSGISNPAQIIAAQQKYGGLF